MLSIALLIQVHPITLTIPYQGDHYYAVTMTTCVSNERRWSHKTYHKYVHVDIQKSMSVWDMCVCVMCVMCCGGLPDDVCFKEMGHHCSLDGQPKRLHLLKQLTYQSLVAMETVSRH